MRSIPGVLRDFHLLDDLTKRRTVTSSVFTANTDLLSTLTLYEKMMRTLERGGRKTGRRRAISANGRNVGPPSAEDCPATPCSAKDGRIPFVINLYKCI